MGSTFYEPQPQRRTEQITVKVSPKLKGEIEMLAKCLAILAEERGDEPTGFDSTYVILRALENGIEAGKAELGLARLPKNDAELTEARKLIAKTAKNSK